MPQIINSWNPITSLHGWKTNEADQNSKHFATLQTAKTLIIGYWDVLILTENELAVNPSNIKCTLLESFLQNALVQKSM